ncbi:BTAD domain-containing putative transcriptional regulator [Amycolatopsis cynarae]|uniref:BTAD domain-containing putative transcriptional regulator n=1 Tax=Amycolatopsis cynarae TaxID=2995223 RepID=A0ABY7B695_9PSEU|nr:CBS domain-containing protein [Amycolatopsis sp. HUAS 11-8]WAL67862.1 BTAD domain-containing putative transcriptional regulator [Amycolatopsis sp. HUAS 11-8]
MSQSQQRTRQDGQPNIAGERSGPQVSIQLLGRFAVRRHGREQPDRAFGGRQARQLLRMLALSRGTLLSKDVAIEALWPTHPPVDASGNVEILISRIRRALGERSLILTGSGGYSLVGDDRCWVDIEAFLTAVARGQAELNHDPDASLTAFRAALALWHGEPLAEDAYAAWAAEHRHHLLRAHLDALEGAATAALAAGDTTGALTWAQTATDGHPLREAAALLLVRALAAGGDRAAALASFDAFGRRLADELGIDPSADALRLRQQVLCDEVRPANSAPTVPGVVGADPPTSVLPLAGRDQARARIAGLLADRQVRVALVRGAPGSGNRPPQANRRPPRAPSATEPPERQVPGGGGARWRRSTGGGTAVKVKEIMTTPVVTVPVDAHPSRIAAVLREHRISGVPVVDPGGAVVGLVSEYDLLARSGGSAGDVMSTAVISVTEDTDVDEVRHLLVERRIHRVPVLAGARLTGIVSRSDVVALLATEWVCQVCGEAVRGGQAPASCPKCQAGTGQFVLQEPNPGS